MSDQGWEEEFENYKRHPVRTLLLLEWVRGERGRGAEKRRQ